MKLTITLGDQSDMLWAQKTVEHFHFYEEPFFECTNGGDYWGPDGTIYWFEGVQMCPRCHHEFPVSDSS